MPNVSYTDDQGFIWVVSVPPDAPEETYKWGVPVGPPDLSSLPINRKQRKALQNELVTNDMIVAPELMGRRQELRAILKKLGLPETLLREIISLYQKLYYTD